MLNLVASREKEHLLTEKNEKETFLEKLKHLTDVTANDMIAKAVICILYTGSCVVNSTSVGCDLKRMFKMLQSPVVLT